MDLVTIDQLKGLKVACMGTLWIALLSLSQKHYQFNSIVSGQIGLMPQDGLYSMRIKGGLVKAATFQLQTVFRVHRKIGLQAMPAVRRLMALMTSFCSQGYLSWSSLIR